MAIIDRVNVYRSNGEWCYAALAAGEHDHSDVLDVPTDATAAQAATAAKAMFDGAEIVRVSDVSW